MRYVLLTLMMALMLTTPLVGCDNGDDTKTAKTDTKKTKKGDSKKPKKDSSKKDAPKKDSKKEASSKKDGPKKGETKKDEPKKEDAKKEEPKKEEPASKIAGKPFEGPPSKAIVGQWDIRLNKDKLPKGIQNFEELEKMATGTMKFDGKTAVVNIAGQADAVPYNIVSDEKNVLVLALAGSRKAKFRITFLDHNNIALKDDLRDGELLGTRAP